LIDEIEREFPRFRIVDKQGSLLSRVLHVALVMVTLGGQREFLTHYHTVIGDTLYVPSRWASTPALERMVTLRHERVHLRQRRRLGMLAMAFVYLVPILPLGLAYGRARLEWEAYVETLRATAELFGLEAAESTTLREHVVRRFTGPEYGWMWPFRKVVDRWYDAALAEIRQERRPPSAGLA
jgi:hypothetical protein